MFAALPSWRDYAFVASVVTASGISMLWLPLFGQDEAVHLIYPELMADGRVPNRDFFSVYGPGHFHLLQRVFAATGPSLQVERVVAITYHVAIAFGVMRLVRARGPLSSRVAGYSCAGLFIGFLPVAFPWFGGLALIIWSLALAANHNRRDMTLVAGLLGGLAAYWRPEMGILLASSIPLLLRNPWWRQYVLGAALGLVPTIAHTLANIHGVYHDIVAGRIGVSAQPELTTVPLGAWLLLALTLASGIVLILGARETPVTAACGTLSILILPQGLQRIDMFHVVFVGCFTVPVGLAFLADRSWLRETISDRAELRRAAQAVPATLLCLSTIVTGVAALSVPAATASSKGRSVTLSVEDAHHVRAVVDAVRSAAPKGSAIFVGPRDLAQPGGQGLTSLYFLLPEYKIKSYYVELAPGASERPNSRLSADVKTADMLILSENSTHALQRSLPHLPKGSDEANIAVRENFCAVRRIEGTELFRRGPC